MLTTPGERRRALEEECERILPILERMDVEKVLLIGSLATGRTHAASDLDLIVVAETQERYLDRVARFHDAIQPCIALDLFVYTPEELSRLEKESSFVRHALTTAKVIYDVRTSQREPPVAGAVSTRP